MRRTQRLVLLATILGSGVATIDSSIVNVALPAIERDLGGGLTAQQWISNAYLLTLGALILIGGSLGDIYGRRRVFTIGVFSFGVLSLACALAPSIGVLIAARALQGVAGALMIPSSLALIVDTFESHARSAAVGTWTAWGAIASIIGPLAGGLILDSVSWRWIFAINIPIVVITIVLILVAVSAERPAQARRVDVLGAVLCVAGFGGVVFALIEEPHYGWSDPVTLVALLTGLCCLTAFLLFERRAEHPMLTLSLFRSRNFAIANIETLLVYAGLSILIFFMIIFVQEVAGFTALEAGATTLPVTAVMFVGSRRFGALADRLGPRLFMGLGPLLAAGGILLLLRTGLRTSYLTVLLPALLVFACGLAMTVAPLTATVLTGIGERNAGIASAINNATARLAGLTGISLAGLVASGTLGIGGFAHNSESVTAFHHVTIVCAVLVGAGGVIGLTGIVNPRSPTRSEQSSIDAQT